MAWCSFDDSPHLFLTFDLHKGTGHGTFAGSVFLEVWGGLILSLNITTTNVILLLQEWHNQGRIEDGASTRETEADGEGEPGDEDNGQGEGISTRGGRKDEQPKDKESKGRR